MIEFVDEAAGGIKIELPPAMDEYLQHLEKTDPDARTILMAQAEGALKEFLGLFIMAITTDCSTNSENVEKVRLSLQAIGMKLSASIVEPKWE